MLNWSQQFSILLFLDSNEYHSPYGRYECMLAVGGVNSSVAESLEELQTLHQQEQDWLFGHIAYEYKDELHRMLSSGHSVGLGIPTLRFFIPDTVCYIDAKQQALCIETIHESPEEIFKAVSNIEIATPAVLPTVAWNHAVVRRDYMEVIARIKEHIVNGDCYELNYCTGSFAENVNLEPLSIFKALNTLSPAPFAAYYKLDDVHMACASPERYLHKQGNHLIAQPIKGTARRDIDPVKDSMFRDALRADIKEQAENVMITDLMRNDLARCSETGSVHVDELFGIYTFPQVHQMISTISSTLRSDMTFEDALRFSFPMGSMTGAPKIKVMQLIELYEQSRRELFSGTVGYISPEGNFDFNVIIRSLFYNATTQRLSYQTGGAITADSTPEKEYDEMRLKAWALERIFEG